MIARVCISMISGNSRPSRQPRRPSIGFCSCRFCTSASRRLLRAVRLLGLPERLRTRDLDEQLLERRQELVQRRVDEPDDHRQAVHRLEDAVEVTALHRQQLGQLDAALLLVRRKDHLLHDRKAFLLHEHVLGAAEADALRAERASAHGVVRVVAVRPDLEPAERIRPAQDLLELAGDLRHRAWRPARR